MVSQQIAAIVLALLNHAKNQFVNPVADAVALVTVVAVVAIIIIILVFNLAVVALKIIVAAVALTNVNAVVVALMNVNAVVVVLMNVNVAAVVNQLQNQEENVTTNNVLAATLDHLVQIQQLGVVANNA